MTYNFLKQANGPGDAAAAARWRLARWYEGLLNRKPRVSVFIFSVSTTSVTTFHCDTRTRSQLRTRNVLIHIVLASYMENNGMC